MREKVENSTIWNPWHGCRRYSEGCEHCYMFYLDSKRGLDGGNIRRVTTNFDLPLKKDRHGEFKVRSGDCLRVCMTSDFFLEEADPWRGEAWAMMRSRSDVTFWLLTKRVERIERCLPEDWGDGYENVSLNITVENQRRADERFPILLALPARHKGAMAAPLLGPMDVEAYLATGQIESLFADGENYEGGRPLHYEWVADLYEQCVRQQVPFSFFGIGNTFVKDGRTYHVCKAYQHVQALRSGLQYPPTTENLQMQPRCRRCDRRDTCNGCNWCGDCLGC